MANILGIDAAWSSKKPSGLALIEVPTDNKPKLVRAGRSYSEYINGTIKWEKNQQGTKPLIDEVLKCSPVIDVIALDIPLADYRIKGRRNADQAVSRKYASRYAPTHSPTVDRPGEISTTIYEQLTKNGFKWATEYIDTPAFIEIYPHVSIIELFGYEERLKYKVDKRRNYWPDISPAERKTNIINNLNELRSKLKSEINNVGDMLTKLDVNKSYTIKFLKGYEDLLDALVCALTGYYYLNKKAKPMGDNTGAIWVPCRDV